VGTDISTDTGRDSVVRQALACRSFGDKLKFVGHLTLLLTLLVFFNSCRSTSRDSAPPVSAGALLREYRQSSTWVRQKYDGKEISVRGLVMSAIVLPGDVAEQGTVWLKESESETSGQVGCWFSNQRRLSFQKSAAAST